MKNDLPLDFHPLVFCGEARPTQGEDSWLHAFHRGTGVVGVFDGCGGSGARSHKEYGGHSEAYMAARLCAGAVYSCAQSGCLQEIEPGVLVQDVLAPAIAEMLHANKVVQNQVGVKVKGMRTLPATMAAALIQAKDNAIAVSPVWAGDSRVYVLDASGLSQLTVDDSNQPDPMEGLYDDGVLTNVLCEDSPIRLNCHTYHIKPPFLVIASTDGCFGYVSTPMEFEGMILHTLLESDSVAQWEDNLQKLTASFAGDDHTLCMASFGFGSFENIRSVFSGRYSHLHNTYLERIWATPWEDRETRRKLWASYRNNYMKYIEGGKT